MNLDETIDDLPDNPSVGQLKEKLVQYYQKIDDYESKNESLFENLKYLQKKYELLEKDQEQTQSLLEVMDEKYIKECQLNEKLGFQHESDLEIIKNLKNALKLEQIKTLKFENLSKQYTETHKNMKRLLDTEFSSSEKEKMSLTQENLNNLSSPSPMEIIKKLSSYIRQLKSNFISQTSKVSDTLEKSKEDSKILNSMKKKLELEMDRKEEILEFEKTKALEHHEELKRNYEETLKELENASIDLKSQEKRFEVVISEIKKSGKLELSKEQSKVEFERKKNEYFRFLLSEKFEVNISSSSSEINYDELLKVLVSELEGKLLKEVEVSRKLKDLDCLREENKVILENNRKLESQLKKLEGERNCLDRKNEEFSVILGEYMDIDEDLEKMDQQFEIVKNLVEKIIPSKSLTLRRVIEKFKILMEELRNRIGKSKHNTTLTLSTVE